ncbi:MAG: heme-binding protein [Rhodospirillaceae bacterium]|nr:heme-binding protein [Rhodospirillaceae bacterium]
MSQGPVPYGTPITLDQAKKVMAGAEAEAKANGWSVVIYIVDSTDHLVLVQRLDNTQYGSIIVAEGKARTALNFRRPSKAFQDLIGGAGPGSGFLSFHHITAVQGGLPIIVDGKIIGAIGVSGVTSAQDEQIATAGITALTG